MQLGEPSLAGVLGRSRERHAVRQVPVSWYRLKRVLDILMAIVGLIVTAPLIIVGALATACVSRGSPFFAQERIGRNGAPFKLFKLRTMVAGAHLQRDELLALNEASGPVFKIRNDPRLHAFGAIMRRTSIDELPNLINVLRGEMSMVGPRPPLPSEVEHYDSRALRRLTVKPGITCLWQAGGRSNVDFATWMELDNRYVDEWTPWGDLAIVLRTVPAVIRGEGAH